MLRSQIPGISGYVRLERRTLIGTLEFTLNGISSGSEMYAVLLRRSNGIWNAIKLDQFSMPRSGQAGLIWKFDPRNIHEKAFEQYELTAVIELKDGICNLLLCGSINGSVEVDWTEVKTAACRLFTPVRISGAHVPAIPERQSALSENEDMDPAGQNDITYKETSAENAVFTHPDESNNHCSTITDDPLNEITAPSESYNTPINETENETIPPDQEASGKLNSSESFHHDVTAQIPDQIEISSDTAEEYSCSSAKSSVCDSLSQTPQSPADSEIESVSLNDTSNRDNMGTGIETPSKHNSESPVNHCSEREEPRMAAIETPRLNDLPDMPAQKAASYNAGAFPAHSAETAADDLDIPAYNPDIEYSDDFDRPASGTAAEPDELDMPAFEEQDPNIIAGSANNLDQIAINTSTDTQAGVELTAGNQLVLNDPAAQWPKSIESLRALFFSSEAVVPFETNGFVFIRTPLSDDCCASNCLCGIRCEGGVPVQVCYAIPAQYTPEPPLGLEEYTWRGDHLRGYWIMIDDV